MSQEMMKEMLKKSERVSRERGLLGSVLNPDLEILLQKRNEDYTYKFLTSRILEQVEIVRKVELEYSHAQTNLSGRIRELSDYLDNQ